MEAPEAGPKTDSAAPSAALDTAAPAEAPDGGLPPAPADGGTDIASTVAVDALVAGRFVVVAAPPLRTTEAGGQATFALRLESAPAASVTVSVSSGNSLEGTVSPGMVVFTPVDWNGPHVVTVTGVDDPMKDGDSHYSIVTAPAVSADPVFSGVDPPDVEVINVDDDRAGVFATAGGALETSETGTRASFTVALACRPRAQVTIPLTSSDATEGTVSPASLTFTPESWMTPQTVTVTGVSDALADGDQVWHVILGPAVSSDPDYNGAHPADVPVTNRDVMVVTARLLSTGYYHSCALVADGRAYCWGSNPDGQLGDGTTMTRTSPTAVLGGLAFATLEARYSHTCGLTATGLAYCWGANFAGQLGDGTTVSTRTPTPVAGGLTFTRLSLGYGHTCGVTASGQVHCWGRNTLGQLGDGTAVDRAVPTAIASGLTFSRIAAASEHTCALAATGEAHCWGSNESGKLGDGTWIHDRSTPGAVLGSMTFVELSASWESTCGLTAAGAAYCWGGNATGQLGDGTSVDRNLPTGVSGGLAFTALGDKGLYHQCGLVGGNAYCWGLNATGQLGDGSMTNRTVPTAVTGGLSFAAIRPGFQHTCAMSPAGTIQCWGANGVGQLGDGTTTNRPVPTGVTLPLL